MYMEETIQITEIVKFNETFFEGVRYHNESTRSNFAI